ncbi:MAG: EAL domain-containing response regulator [Planctomycetes bacterium]|nr:EAL domain-containing response regulator [Planctomycetota bacterium]
MIDAAEELDARATILVVDDEQADVRLLERILAREGYLNIVTTTDSGVAVELVRQLRPDLILLDLHMPDPDGYTVLRSLRSEGIAHPYLPILALGADDDASARRRALSYGGNDFLSMPVDADEVILQTRNLLETRLLHETLEERNRQLAAQVQGRMTELADSEAGQIDLARWLGRLQAGATPEETATVICEGFAQTARFDVVSVVSFLSEDLAIPLGAAGSLASVVPLEVPLPRSRARYLWERASQGPWAEPWVARPEDAAYGLRFTHGGLKAALYAPLRDDGGLLGLLIAGTTSELTNDELSRRLPSLLQMGSLARAVLLPALESRRHQASLRQTIQAVIGESAFWPVFQPVVGLSDGDVVGHEALTRFTDETRPDVRFAEASAVGLGTGLEEACIRAAVSAANALPGNGWLSLNASPDLILDPGRLPLLLRDVMRLVVLEITEHVAIDDYTQLRAAIDRLGGRVRLAIDDAGAGFASFRHIIELRPDFVKVDIGLVRGIDLDASRQALVAGMSHFATKTGCTLIAEGIETEGERKALRDLGVMFGQGYLLGRPDRLIKSAQA